MIMDLKNTKATERKSTESKFKSLVLARGIVKLSAASKSTSQNKRHQRNQAIGLDSEARVIEQMANDRWQLLFQRAKTEIAEIDLIFQKKNQIRLIEVKTLNDSWRSFQRISHRQIQKLILNQIYFTQVVDSHDVSCWVAWVGDQKIEYVQIN